MITAILIVLSSLAVVAAAVLQVKPGRYFIYSSANVAFVRLKSIVAADRAAVPCGRWVPVRDACVAVDRWQYQNYMRRAFGLKELPPLPSREVLPRYRWSERR